MRKKFNKRLAKKAILEFCPSGQIDGVDQIAPFQTIGMFLDENPESLSWRGRDRPTIYDTEGLNKLAKKFVNSFSRSDFPVAPNTVPDELVSLVMEIGFGYAKSDCERIKVEHQHSMGAENCVGALLERYLDSKLRAKGWACCYGEYINKIDFVCQTKDGWYALQIKNRDNSENSSSKAVRDNTDIQKWFRTFSKTGKTNWDNLPPLMSDCGFSECDFIAFTYGYLQREKEKIVG